MRKECSLGLGRVLRPRWRLGRTPQWSQFFFLHLRHFGRVHCKIEMRNQELNRNRLMAMIWPNSVSCSVYPRACRRGVILI